MNDRPQRRQCHARAVRRSRFAALFMVLSLFVFPPAPPALAALTEASDHYERALQLLQEEEFQGALIELKNALKEDPDNVPARLLIGNLYLLMGDGKGAEDAIERATRAGADESLTVLPLARAYLLQNKNEDLLSRIRSGRRTNDIEAGILSVRGEALLAMRRLDEAQVAFTTAEKLDPLQPQSALGLARVALLRGNMPLSRQLAETAITKGPEVSETWYFRGELHRLLGQADRSLADFTKAIELRGTNLNALRGRAGVYLQLDRWEEAKQDLLEMQRFNPDDPYTAYMMAQVLAHEGNKSGAQAALQDAAANVKTIPLAKLQTDPDTLMAAGVISFALSKFDDTIHYIGLYLKLNSNHVGARKLLAQSYINNGSVARAVEILRPAVQIAPKDSQLLALIGTSLVDIGRYDEGMGYMERAVQLRPDSAGTRMRRAEAQFTAGNPDEAIAELESVIDLKPESTQPRYVLAMQFIRLGEFDKALEMARSIVELRPTNPLAQDLLGQALVGSGKPKEATAAFERALELNPDYVNARFNLGQIALATGDLDKAEADYTAAFEKKGDDVRVMKGLADIYKQRNNIPEAILWMERVRNVRPEDAAAQADLILLYIRAGKNETAFFLAEKLYQEHPTTPVALEAFARANQAMDRTPKAVELFRIMSDLVRESAPRMLYVASLQQSVGDDAGTLQTLEKAVRTDPKFLPAQITLIERLARAEKLDEALARLQLLESAHPDADVSRLRGDLLAQVGRFAEAAEAYRKGMVKQPDNAGLAVNLYLARKKAGDGNAALGDLGKWVKAHPDDTTARFAHASALIAAGRDDEAIAEHEAMLAKQPNDARLQNNLALLYYRKGNPKALEFARKAYDLAPGPPDIKDTLGWLLVEFGQPDKGLTYLREAQVRDSRNPEIRLHLAVALSKLGRTNEARQAFEELVRLSPDSDAAKRARELLKELPRS